MRCISEFIFLSTSKITFIPTHTAILECLEWQGMKITMGGYHSRVILFIFTSFQAVSSFKNDVGMTEWEWNEGYFWSKAKSWVLKCASFHHHSLISCQYPIHNMITPFIPVSFNHSNVILSFECHSIIHMSFHHLSLILSITCHADNIPSFWCHSIHSRINRAWNDKEWHFGGMTGMWLEWWF